MAPYPTGTPGAAVFSANNVPASVNLSPLPGSGYAIGDVLLCFTACRSAAATVATPSGWTQLLNVAGTNGRLALFGKVATSTSEAAPTVAWSGLTTGTSGSPCGARCQAFKDLTLDIDVLGTVENGAASSTLSASGAALTIATANDLALCLSTRLDDVGTWSAPSGLAMINSNLTTSGADFSFAWAYGSGPAVGSFTPNDFGLSGASSFASSGIVIALKAVPPPPPPVETLFDDFNRADGQLDAGAGAAIWTQTYYDNPGRTNLQVVGNRLADGTTTWQSAYTKFELQADFDLVIDCVTPPVAPNLEFGMFFSMTNPGTSGFNGYGFFWGNGSWFMRRYTGGVNQGNIASTSGPLLAGDTFWVRKRGSDIRVYRRPSGGEYALLMAATDATYGQGVVVIELSDTTQRWDNLRGGPKASISGSFALPIIFGKSVSGIAIPASLYQKAVIADGATGYWRMEEGSTDSIKDWAPPGTDTLLTVSGATKVGGLLPNVPNSYAKYFSNGYALRSGAIFPINTFTLEAWIRRDSAFGNELILTQYDQGFHLQFNSDGTLTLKQSKGQAGVKSSALKYNDLQTHHIVVSRAGIGGEVVFYRNGVPEVISGAAFTADLSLSTWGLYVAGDYDSFIPLTGVMDELAIYPTVLTPAQVLNHYDLATHVPTTLYGSVAFPISFNKDIKGTRKTLGQLALPVTFSKNVDGKRKTFGQLQSPLIFGKAVAGQRKTFGQTSLPITVEIDTAGIRAGLTLYGAISLPVTFGKDVQGQRKAFGQVTMPLTFVKDVRGQRKTFGQVVFPIIFTKEAVGRKNVFGQLSMQTLFGKETSGQRRTFSQLAMPITFSKEVAGRRKTFGQVSLPVSFVAFVNGLGIAGPKTYYGQLIMPLTFNKQVAAYRKTFGQVTAPFIFGTASQGQRKTFSQLILPLDFEVMIESGRIGTYGQISLPIIVDIEVDGKVKARGVILNYAEMIYLGAQPVIAVYTEGQKVWPST